MKLILILVGKTDKGFVKEGFELYRKRLERYLPLEVVEIPTVKQAGKLPPEELKKKEGEEILKRIPDSSYTVLLDERGKHYTSVEVARWIQQKMNTGIKNLVFIVGGAYGFSEALYAKADMKLALSPMTFSHQVIRVIVGEQLYRAFTIIYNEPYHNA
ncbi:MAG: 23S rRNA (pseudouridine(1915)-N(3))-methyltransferase RlmH [Bacteroidales bacterium]|nr:23S rRNA (pseudouridine(1915)-N(3))-methyltransferase RlmH [Bacteroidales bacterium]